MNCFINSQAKDCRKIMKLTPLLESTYYITAFTSAEENPPRVNSAGYVILDPINHWSNMHSNPSSYSGVVLGLVYPLAPSNILNLGLLDPSQMKASLSVQPSTA